MASLSFSKAKISGCDGSFFRAGKPLLSKFKAPVSVILVYAEWCHYCQEFVQDFIKFSKNSGVKCYVMNEAKAGKIVERLDVPSYPTLLKVKGGKIDRFQGQRKLTELKKWAKA